MREMKDSGVEWIGKIPKDSGNIKFLWYVMFCMAKNDCFGTSPEKATIAHLPEML